MIDWLESAFKSNRVKSNLSGMMVLMSTTLVYPGKVKTSFIDLQADYE